MSLHYDVYLPENLISNYPSHPHKMMILSRQVSKSPSELEVVLGVIKSSCKAQLGREGQSEATKQLLLLEV